MEIFKCDCCKEIEPKFRQALLKLNSQNYELCFSCGTRVEGFMRSITIDRPLPEPKGP